MLIWFLFLNLGLLLHVRPLAPTTQDAPGPTVTGVRPCALQELLSAPRWVSGFHLGTNQESSSERLQDCRDPSPNSGWNDRSIKWHKSNVKVLLHLGSRRTGPRGAGLSLQIWDRKPALFPPAWVCVTPLTTGAGSCSRICPPSECAAQARMIYNTLSPGRKKFRVRLKFNKFPGGLFRFACCLTDLAQIPPCCQAILGKPDTGAN